MNILIVERTRGNSLFTSRIVPAQFRLQFIAHLHRHQLGSLENGFIGEHQTHIAIDTDHPLLQGIGVSLKRTGNEIDALDQLATDQ